MLAALLAAGYSVLTPFGHKRYDLAWAEGTKLIRVQCKTGRFRDGVIMFSTSSHSRYGSGMKRRNYRLDVDFFGVYCAETERVYLVPVGDVPINTAMLRVSPAKNAQSKRVMWARDFELRPAR